MTSSPATPTAAAVDNRERPGISLIFMGSLAISSVLTLIVGVIGFAGQPGPPKDASDANNIILLL